jgi:hypothetical protein
MKDEPYVTTLLAGALNVGSVGIRIVGLFWLITGLAFMACGTGAIAGWSSWRSLAFGMAVFSMVLCILGLPGAKIGILANALVLLYMLGVKIGWVS